MRAILLLSSLLALASCRAVAASESIAADFHEMQVDVRRLTDATEPALKDIAAGTRALREAFAPSSQEPTEPEEGAAEAPEEDGTPWTSIWGGAVTLLLGYRFVGGRKFDVRGIVKRIWGGVKGFAGALDKVAPNGKRPSKSTRRARTS